MVLVAWKTLVVRVERAPITGQVAAAGEGATKRLVKSSPPTLGVRATSVHCIERGMKASHASALEKFLKRKNQYLFRAINILRLKTS
jgi:hypothetical protein